MLHVRSRSFLVPSFTLLAACAASLPPAETPPAVGTRVDPMPAAPPSRVTLRLAFPLEGLDALAREFLVLPQAESFTPVTSPGANPEVEVRYASSLAGLHFRNVGDALEVRADVHYHATLRARAKTPFGRVWLTQGTAWGTPQKPGRIEVTLRSRLEVTGDWALRSRTELVKVKPKAPATKKVCSSGAFKICVDAKLVEREIHRQLESTVRGQVEAELPRLDRALVAQVPLREAAASLWEGLQREGARVGLVPEALAVSAPTVSEEGVGLDVRLLAQPQGDAGGLPPARDALSGADQLALAVSLSWAELGARFAGPEPLALEDSEWGLAEISVRGAATESARYWVALTLARAERRRTVHLTAELQPRGAALAWKSFTWTPASQSWLEEARLRGPLEAALARMRADMTDPLGAHAARVASTLSRALGMIPLQVAPLECFEIVGAHAGVEGIALRAFARGCSGGARLGRR